MHKVELHIKNHNLYTEIRNLLGNPAVIRMKMRHHQIPDVPHIRPGFPQRAEEKRQRPRPAGINQKSPGICRSTRAACRAGALHQEAIRVSVSKLRNHLCTLFSN